MDKFQGGQTLLMVLISWVNWHPSIHYCISSRKKALEERYSFCITDNRGSDDIIKLAATRNAEGYPDPIVRNTPFTHYNSFIFLHLCSQEKIWGFSNVLTDISILFLMVFLVCKKVGVQQNCKCRPPMSNTDYKIGTWPVQNNILKHVLPSTWGGRLKAKFLCWLLIQLTANIVTSVQNETLNVTSITNFTCSLFGFF